MRMRMLTRMLNHTVREVVRHMHAHDALTAPSNRPSNSRLRTTVHPRRLTLTWFAMVAKAALLARVSSALCALTLTFALDVRSEVCTHNTTFCASASHVHVSNALLAAHVIPPLASYCKTFRE